MKLYYIVHAAPISVCLETSSYKIEVQILQFNIHPNIDALSGFNFKTTVCWDDLTDSFLNAINKPNILLDKYQLSSNKCLDLVKGIVFKFQGTAYIIPDGTFDPDSSMCPASGTSAVTVASSRKCDVKLSAKGLNWVNWFKIR